MPCARMHWEYLSARSYCLAATAGLVGVVPAGAAAMVRVVLPMRATEDGDAPRPPPQAAASKVKAARARAREAVIAKRRPRPGWGGNEWRAMAHVVLELG